MLPPARYEIFTHNLADGGFGGAYRKIEEWMKSSEYEEAYPFEVQCCGESESELDYWIPIKARNRS